MASQLANINSPTDLKQLSLADLELLAAELREFIIDHVSITGGHLAPSLGVVELTLALHYVFDSPRDKIIWDVGHQAYAHKILTGRRERFRENRQYGGISGFPSRSESEHDAFGTGHASTSISAGFGMVCARDLAGEDYHVISVIGDGAMTGGLAFEGLNNAGASQSRFIVVLNDNKMSISPNVGALSRYLTLLITNPRLNRLKKELLNLTFRLPQGDRIARSWGRLESSIKAMLTPGSIFEQLGFRYIGPLDGHEMADLIRFLRKIKELPGPILLHVVTHKGKGYAPAEENATQFHGIGSFVKATGKPNGTSKAPTYTEVFGQTLTQLGEQHPELVAITAAMMDGAGLAPFKARFPKRFFDVGIAESHAVTFAAALSTQGKRPVVAVYSTFLQRSYDQIVHDVALQKLPVIFAIDRAGIVGEDGPTHHGCFDLAFLRHVPNLTIIAPRDEAELQQMLSAAVSWEKGPIAIRYPRAEGIGCPLFAELPGTIPQIGKGEVGRNGSHGAILALGTLFWEAMEAAETLAAEGLSLTVVNMRSLKPLDGALLSELGERFTRFLTIEDGALSGGFGSAVLDALSELGDQIHSVKRLGIPDRFIEHGARSILLKKLGLTAPGIITVAREFFRGRGREVVLETNHSDVLAQRDLRHHRQFPKASDLGRSAPLSDVVGK